MASLNNLPDRAARLISIGHNCVTKFQIARYFYFQKAPSGDLTAYRNQLFNPTHRSIEFDTHIFDWQTTPFPAVISYIRQDFRNMFEFTHLSIDQIHDAVINARMGTSHKHAFTASGDRLSEDDIRTQYRSARAKFEHLAEKFRTLLASNGPIVYVLFCRDVMPSNLQIVKFFWSLKQRNPRHISRLALVGTEGQFDPPKLGLLFRYARWYTVAPSAKIGPFEWEGDDESWDRVISDIVQWGRALSVDQSLPSSEVSVTERNTNGRTPTA
jgi:hypothetical protein